MALSFGEGRAQTQTLRNVYSWLQSQSRYFDCNSNAMTIEQLEKLCGPIQDTQFDADLAKEIVLNPCLNMAEGMLVEYSIILGYKPTDFILPDGYSFVSRLPNGDPGKELDLIISVLQYIVNGNEAHSEIAEKLNKLIEEKSSFDNNESDLPKIYATLSDRIEKYDEVSDEEIQDFIDQIEKDSSYQTHLYLFKQYRPLLLKGSNHVKFIQNSYVSDSVDRVISKPYFDSVFYVMESIVSRLSIDELEMALAESKEHFSTMPMKRRDYISDLKLSTNNSKKNVVTFTSRVLLRGPKAACDDLAVFVRDMNVICMKLFADLPPSLYKFLLEREPPVLLQVLFSMKGLYASNNFIEPMDCLVRQGTFPLHKLLKVMLKDSQNFKPHLAKLLNCHITRDCIEKAATTEKWEETAQALITVMAILCDDYRVDKHVYMGLLDVMKKSSKDKSLHEEWLAKYENSEAVAVWIGLMKKKEEPVKDEVKEGGVKMVERETKNMTKREMERENERIRKEEKEKKRKEEKRQKDKEKRKNKREEKEREKNKDVEEVKVEETEDTKDLKTEVREEVKKEEMSDNEKEVKVEHQVEKEEEEMKIDTDTTHTEDKETTTDEEHENLDAPTVTEDKDETSDGEYEDLDATVDTKDKEDATDEEHENLDAPTVTEDKDDTSDGESEDLDYTSVTKDKEDTTDEEYENLDAPSVAEDKDETSDGESEDLEYSSVTGDETSDGEFEDTDEEHMENKANIEKMSLSEASTQENSEESDMEHEDLDGGAVDKEKGTSEEENVEAEQDQNKVATKEDTAGTEQEVKDEGGVEEGNAETDQVSSAKDEEDFVLIDSSSDSEVEVEPIVEFPESDEEGLDATQSSTNTQDGAHGFTSSINHMDQIGKTE